MAAYVDEIIICANDCNDILPVPDFSICAPEVNFGEIDAVFITNIGNSLTNVNDIAEWTSRMAGVGATKIIELQVTGDKPAPGESEIVISRGVVVTGAKDHVINIEIQQTNHANYEFMRSLECSRKLLVWYRTAAGKMYGGNDGIEMTIKLNHIIPKGTKEITSFVGTGKWSSKFHPQETEAVI